MIVYLCGPINGCTDEEANDWRTYAKTHLKCETLDPMRRDYRGRELEDGIAEEIVRGDEEDLQIATHILVNYPKPSTGTDMEIRAAKKEYGRLICTVTPKLYRPSPWLVVHSDILLYSMESAVEWLNRFVK